MTKEKIKDVTNGFPLRALK